ncbi:MAG TPA: right-handed parallel beta-helix repeat-containing protein [Alphaproteobacteria bacterium]|nr:right-handed parallel beta-helix repeat-containing protein [Alphaproteobacteria bacterium]
MYDQDNKINKEKDWKSKLLLVATVLLMLSLFILVVKPDFSDGISKITGLLISDDKSETVESYIAEIYTENTIKDLALQEIISTEQYSNILSVKINGRYSGEFKIWIDSGEGTERILVADSSLIDESDLSGGLSSITGMDILELDESELTESSAGESDAEPLNTESTEAEAIEPVIESIIEETDETSQDVIEEPTEEVIEESSDEDVLAEESVEPSIEESESTESEIEQPEETIDVLEEPVEIMHETTDETIDETVVEDIIEETAEEEIIEEQVQYTYIQDLCADSCSINVPVSDSSNYRLIVELSDGSELFIESVEYIAEKVPELEEIIPEEILPEIIEPVLNETNATINITEIIINEILNETNATEIFNETINISINASNVSNTTVSVELLQYPATVGKPVKWVKRIKSNENITGISLDIPADSTNISVSEIDGEGLGKKELYKKSNDKTEKSESKKPDKDSGLQIAAVSEDFSSTIIETISGEDKILTINEPTDYIEIEYYTEAPEISEEIIEDTTKQVKLSSDMHYVDVTATSSLPQEVSDYEDIILRWKITDASQEDGFNTLNSEDMEKLSDGEIVYKTLEFNLYDTDGNSLYDLIEWTAPHLSNQTFEIIVITDAMILDSDRNFLENVYEIVNDTDLKFANVTDGQYLRVTFERDLQSHNDITIYANSFDNSEISVIDVYERGSNISIAKFHNVSMYSKYQILLTNLTGSEDTFDLKISSPPNSGGISFDFVIDPFANLSSTIFQCGDITASGIYTFNQSITPNFIKCLNITAPDVTIDCNSNFIRNITFTGTAIFTNRSNLTVRNCNINISVATSGNGIVLANSNNSLIINNNITARFAIGISNTSFSNFTGNRLLSGLGLSSIALVTGNSNNFSNNYMNASTTSSNVVINGSNNNFYNNTVVRGLNGITVITTNTGANNRIYNNNVQIASRHGIVINNSVNNTVFSNYISAATAYGIYVYNTSGNIIYDNVINNSVRYNIYVDPSMDFQCNQNITNNTYGNVISVVQFYNSSVSLSNLDINYTIQLCNADDSVLSNITIRNTTSTRNTGLILTKTDRAVISEISTNAMYTGLRLEWNSTNNTIFDSKFNYSAGVGIHIGSGSSNNNFTSITLVANTLHGLNVTGFNNTFTLINSTYNTQNGVNINASNIYLDNVTSTYNNASGIVLTLNGNRLNNTYSSYNWQHGISITVPSSGNNISNSYILSNRRSGIYLDYTQNNTFINFFVYNNSNYTNSMSDIYLNRSSNRSVFISGLVNTTSSLNGIFVANRSQNVTFADMIITGNFTKGISIILGSNVTFLNVSYTNTGDNVSNNAQNINNSLIRKWRYTAYANYSNGTAIAGINISVYDRFGSLINLTTSSAGYAYTNITEYVNNGSLLNYYNNHTFNATNGSLVISTRHNSTNDLSIFDVFTYEVPGYMGIISNCTTIDIPGYYDVNQSITPIGDVCINVTAQNVVINCSGQSFTNTTFTGTVFQLNGFNDAVINCFVNISTNTSATGFIIQNANDSLIFNNTVTAYRGVGTSITSYSNISRNSMINLGGGYVAGTITGNNNTISDNYATGSSSGYNGVIISGDNNIIQYNNFSNASNALTISSGSSNVIRGNYLLKANLVFVMSSSRNMIYGNIVDNSSRVYSPSTTSACNNNFTNNTLGGGSGIIEYYNSSTVLANRTLHGLILCNADNSVISNITMMNYSAYRPNAIEAYELENATMTSINATENYRYTIYLSSVNTSRMSNIVGVGFQNGLYVAGSDYNNFDNISIIQSRGSCIIVVQSSNYNNFTNIFAHDCLNGMSFSSAKNTTVINVTTYNNEQYGVLFTDRSSRNTLTGFTTYNNSEFGLFISDSNNINITSSYIHESMLAGIVIENSTNIIVTNFTSINNSNKTNYRGDVYLNRSANAITLSGGFINSSNAYAIFIDSSYNTSLIDINVSGNATVGLTVLSGYNITNVTLINVSYLTENITGTSISAYKLWHYIGHTNLTSGFPLDGANISIYNRLGSLINLTTNAQGYAYVNLTEYTHNGSLYTHYTNHTFNATNGSEVISREHNITVENNMFEFFTYISEPYLPIYECMNISSPGIYDVNQTIIPAGNVCINITSQNVTLRCNQNTILGTSFTGVAIRMGASNITVKDCIINVSTSSGTAIGLVNSNYSSVLNNNISAAYGIGSSIAWFTNISGNNMTVSQYGSTSLNGSNNSIRHNLIRGSTYGIAISGNRTNIANNMIDADSASVILREGSLNNTVENNNASSPTIFIYFLAGNSASTNNYVYNNTIIDASRIVYAPNAAACDNIVINNSIGDGISYIEFYNYSVTIANRSMYGLILCDADGSRITNVTFMNASGYSPSPLETYHVISANISGLNVTLSTGEGFYANLDNSRVSNVVSRGLSLTSSGTDFNNMTIRDTFFACIGGSFADDNNFTNINLRNCSSGIELYDSSRNRFVNISSQYNLYSGILLRTTSSDTVLINVSVNNNLWHGVYIEDSTGSNITALNSFNNYMSGLAFVNSSRSNVINYTSINNSNKSKIHADIYFNNSDNIYLAGGFINSSNAYAVLLNSSSNISFVDLNISGNSTRDITAYESSNITLINATYSTENITSSSLYRKWKYAAYSNYTIGTPASGIVISVYDYQSSVINLTTASTGYAYSNVSEYFNNGTIVSYYNNYTFNATNGSAIISFRYNLSSTMNMFDIFTFNTSPGCVNVTSSGASLFLDRDINSTDRTCINVFADNVMINCSGRSINGTNYAAASGIYSNSKNTTVVNCTITNFMHGIYFNGTDNSTIRSSNITASNNSAVGIMLENDANNTIISDNKVLTTGESSDAIYLNSGSDLNIITRNQINTTGQSSIGIYVLGSNHNNLTANRIKTDSTSASTIYLFLNSNNNYIAYNNLTAPGVVSYGVSIGSSSNNNFLFQNNIHTAYPGVIISSVANNTISQNNINTTNDGISLFSSINNNITSNSINSTGSSGYGISLSSSSHNNTIYQNTLKSTMAHIQIISSINNTFYYNNFTGGGPWINDSNGTNQFNITVGGVAQGNYYVNITDYEIYDSNLDGWADTGSQYPLNRSTNSSKWLNFGEDFGPQTTSQIVSCQNITTSNIIVNLSANIASTNSTCLNVFAHNVTINCFGYSITGNNYSGASGIYSNSSNTTVLNCNINGFMYGIYYNNTNNGTIQNNNFTLMNNSALGIYLSNSDNNKIISNIISMNGSSSYALSLSSGSGRNNVSSNIMHSTKADAILIYISSSSNNKIINNTMNSSGADAYGIYFFVSANNNHVENNSIYTQGAAARIIYLLTSSGNNITRNTMLSDNINSYGIIANNADNNIFMDNNITTGGAGADAIGLTVGSTDNQITRNNLSVSGSASSLGISGGSNNNNISQNWLNTTSNTLVHISIFNSSNNTIYYNTIAGNGPWVNASNGTNQYNTTVGGYAQGNYYIDIENYDIYDSNSDGFGDTGSDYPLNQSTNSSKWLNQGTDFGPATTSIISSMINITNIVSVGSIDPLESSIKNVSFNFTVNQGAGNATIDVSSAKVIVNNSGVFRQSADASCTGTPINSTAQNISCVVGMYYYDQAGAWSVNISIMDNNNNYTQDISTSFTYNTLYAISLNTALLNTGSLTAGSNNSFAGELILNNTGNFQYTLVQLKAYDLANSTDRLLASNFRINSTNSSSGIVLINDTFINITSATLPRTTDSTYGNESIYLYLDVPLGTAARYYYSLSSWILSLS